MDVYFTTNWDWNLTDTNKVHMEQLDVRVMWHCLYIVLRYTIILDELIKVNRDALLISTIFGFVSVLNGERICSFSL